MEDAPNSLFIRVHEADEPCQNGADVPAGAPGLLVVMGEGSADVLVDFEPAIVGQEFDFGRREGVVLGQFE